MKVNEDIGERMINRSSDEGRKKECLMARIEALPLIRTMLSFWNACPMTSGPDLVWFLTSALEIPLMASTTSIHHPPKVSNAIGANWGLWSSHLCIQCICIQCTIIARPALQDVGGREGCDGLNYISLTESISSNSHDNKL